MARGRGGPRHRTVGDGETIYVLLKDGREFRSVYKGHTVRGTQLQLDNGFTVTWTDVRRLAVYRKSQKGPMKTEAEVLGAERQRKAPEPLRLHRDLSPRKERTPVTNKLGSRTVGAVQLTTMLEHFSRGPANYSKIARAVDRSDVTVKRWHQYWLGKEPLSPRAKRLLDGMPARIRDMFVRVTQPPTPTVPLVTESRTPDAPDPIVAMVMGEGRVRAEINNLANDMMAMAEKLERISIAVGPLEEGAALVKKLKELNL
jgi:hypothetical protein